MDREAGLVELLLRGQATFHFSLNLVPVQKKIKNKN